MKDIVVISNPRTGSSFLVDVLRNFEGIAVYGELFHQTRSSGIVERSELMKMFLSEASSPTGNSDKDISDFVRGSPVASLEKIRGYESGFGTCALAYKLFDRHLSLAQIDQIFSSSVSVALFLTRRRIASFVSERKALKLNKWESADTTGMKVSIDPAAFLKWAYRQDVWYHTMEEMCFRQNVRYVVVPYEKYVNTTLDEVALYLRHVCRGLGVNLDLDSNEVRTKLRKQDNQARIEDSVSNWDEFYTHISAQHDADTLIFGSPLLSKHAPAVP